MSAVKPVKVMLGGTEYAVSRLNIGQIERVADVLDAVDEGAGGGRRKTMAILAIALERCDPAVPDYREVTATREEIPAAVDAILLASGFRAADPNAAAPPGANP